MITLETGQPGSGKTLYCVDKLLRNLVGSVQKAVNADGQKVEIKRRIFTNINGLLLDHVKIEGGAEWVNDKAGWHQGDGNKLGLNNWHEWAKPGDVIVFDEVQKVWPAAPTGSKVPPCIEALETHRHMGVDIIIMTQSPMLIHSNVVRLVGRHLHVRRMGNMALAIVYEWDGCSKTLLFKNALAKAPYRYDKGVFKLYKSAELHTKTPRRIPTLVFLFLAAVVAMVGFTPSVYSKLAGMTDREQIEKRAAALRGHDLPGAALALPAGAASAPARVRAADPAALPVPVAPIVPPAPVYAGCMRIADRCKCLNAQAALVNVAPAECLSVAGYGRGPALDLGNDTPSTNVRMSQDDVAVLTWMAKQRERQ